MNLPHHLTIECGAAHLTKPKELVAHDLAIA